MSREDIIEQIVRIIEKHGYEPYYAYDAAREILEFLEAALLK